MARVGYGERWTDPTLALGTVVTLLKVNWSIYRYWALDPFIMLGHVLSLSFSVVLLFLHF